MFKISLKIFLAITVVICLSNTNSPQLKISLPNTSTSKIDSIEILDGFWKPKLTQWQLITLNDVFDKFEGKYTAAGIQNDINAFRNFENVAAGKRNTGKHDGPPWYDGLVYETIRATGDFLRYHPDSVLEKRVNNYINLIAKAQANGKDDYLDTFTQLTNSKQRWGLHGGYLLWQHDVYNAGMLIDAGVHYYLGTGNAQLLNVACKLANYMYSIMGPYPKQNIVPAHAGPEDALVSLYQLFKTHPEAKNKLSISVKEDHYFELAKFWIDARGHHAGKPEWKDGLNGEKSVEWIKNEGYINIQKYGKHSRPSWGTYAQDSIPATAQKTIEGHSVRATLFATGITAATIVDQSPEYKKTIINLWKDMVGKKEFITGGAGAIAAYEGFGPAYYLPNNAYLETCASVGAGFFSQKMGILFHDGKYIDELEKVLYNGALTGVSLDGTHYTYQNPLEGKNHKWTWHGCPCCPPMFLKMMAALPYYIYNMPNEKSVTVDLFVNSKAYFALKENTTVILEQHSNYPWNGDITIKVNPNKIANFKVNIRIPGWASGIENPFGLYTSTPQKAITLLVNGYSIPLQIKDGYTTLERNWKHGDIITLKLPLNPRVIRASNNVSELRNKVCLAAGPLIYGLEKNANPQLQNLQFATKNLNNLKLKYASSILNGVNIISGKAILKDKTVSFKAIPYYTLGNILPDDEYKVWISTN
ncbi:glycoside hydrolase family 127 protein [Zhouia sp. PK063]|uniref:glycoside hydrolase family 127 protein n=1 Tax=Zhouia sp. PK063 TaxID=3373602 RepID=UPI003797C702